MLPTDGKKHTSATVKKRFWSRDRYLQILSLTLVIALSVFLLFHREKIAALQTYSYTGVFLISLITCSSIAVPVPGWILIAVMGTILNPLLVGIISGIGGTIGELTGYLLGYGGRLIIDNFNAYTKMVEWMKKWGGITIFVLALVPNPVFDLAGAAAGSLRFPAWKFLLYGALGRIPKHIMFAYAGYWGIKLLPS
jgi:membrane protein YqaA with SNARE-associated domain